MRNWLLVASGIGIAMLWFVVTAAAESAIVGVLITALVTANVWYIATSPRLFGDADDVTD